MYFRNKILLFIMRTSISSKPVSKKTKVLGTEESILREDLMKNSSFEDNFLISSYVKLESASTP